MRDAYLRAAGELLPPLDPAVRQAANAEADAIDLEVTGLTKKQGPAHSERKSSGRYFELTGEFNGKSPRVLSVLFSNRAEFDSKTTTITRGN